MKTLTLIIAALAVSGCATNPDGTMTDGSKTAWVVGGILVGAGIIAAATSDSGGDDDDGLNCYWVVGTDNNGHQTSRQVCR